MLLWLLINRYGEAGWSWNFSNNSTLHAHSWILGSGRKISDISHIVLEQPTANSVKANLWKLLIVDWKIDKILTKTFKFGSTITKDSKGPLRNKTELRDLLEQHSSLLWSNNLDPQGFNMDLF